MSQSSSRSEDSVYSTPRPYCKHGACYLQRSFTTYNPGRRFWRCPFGNVEGDCGHFAWYEEPFEGRAKMALLDCIRKGHGMVEKEKRIAEQKIEEIKDELESKIKKILGEKKKLRQELKAAKFRINALYFVLFVTFSIWVVWLFVEKEQSGISSRRCLPR